MNAFKRTLLRLLGVPTQPDPWRARLSTLERGFLFSVFRRSGTTPTSAWQASTDALRTVALRFYDQGRIKPHHIDEALR